MKKRKEKRFKTLRYIAGAILGLITIACFVFGNELTAAGASMAVIGPVLLDLTSVGQIGNTGSQSVTFNMSLWKGFIIVPLDWVANTSYISTMIASLQADTVKPIGSRIYPVWRIAEAKKNDVADASIKLGYGIELNGPRGKYNRTFEIIGGNHDLHVELKKFEGSGFKILGVDDNNTIIGTATATAGSMGGGSMNLMVHMPDWMASQTENTKYLVTVSLTDTAEWFENLRVVKLATSVEQNVKGCLNVELSDNGTQSTTHIFIDAKTNQGQINLYDTYDDELAVAGAWDARDAAGAAIVISSVAKVAGNKGWDLTGTFATGTTITVRGTGPAAWRALTVGAIPGNGFETNVLAIAIP